MDRCAATFLEALVRSRVAARLFDGTLRALTPRPSQIATATTTHEILLLNIGSNQFGNAILKVQVAIE